MVSQVVWQVVYSSGRHLTVSVMEEMEETVRFNFI